MEVNEVFALQRSRSVDLDKRHVASPRPGLIRVIQTQLELLNRGKYCGISHVSFLVAVLELD